MHRLEKGVTKQWEKRSNTPRRAERGSFLSCDRGSSLSSACLGIQVTVKLSSTLCLCISISPKTTTRKSGIRDEKNSSLNKKKSVSETEIFCL